jgi:hypothetical protein
MIDTAPLDSDVFLMLQVLCLHRHQNHPVDAQMAHVMPFVSIQMCKVVQLR